MKRILAVCAIIILAFACSESNKDPSKQAGDGGTGGGGGENANLGGNGGGTVGLGGNFGAGAMGGGSSSPEQFAELWYAVDQLLVLITLDTADGSVVSFQSSPVMGGLEVGQNAITMLDDGSLLGARLSQLDDLTRFYHIPNPPRDGSDVTPIQLGVMPDGIMLEGLYTDCDGRVYGMDTGEDDTNPQGNRLLRFTGDPTAGDFTFVVVSDLATADVADIDDMSPGITANEITDNPGLAIDSGTIHTFNYQTGVGTMVANGGSYGIHALGGALFDDVLSRLYVLSVDAELFKVDPVSYALSGVLGTGPSPAAGVPGWSGLAGPLTNCTTGFVPN